MKDDNEPSQKSSILGIISSTLAAFIGVQSDKNREKDFNQKSFIPFFISGLIMITIFFCALIFMAKQIAP